MVIIITGEEGLQHCYSDRYRPDGVFEYFGEGQVGDMQLQRGNRGIAEHSALGKGLLLFRKTDDGVRFEGENTRTVIKITLRPKGSIGLLAGRYPIAIYRWHKE